MSYRLAITVAGAVSLGSYEAGVLFEIIDAIKQHNQDPTTPANNRIFVDVLTGASAGGMSATVLAQKLRFEAGSLADPYNNTLYRAWVEDVDLEPLLALQPDEGPSHSILSSDLIDTLSAKYLTQRYASHIQPPADPHPASANSIRLGLALSNLNGVDYEHDMKPGGTFIYTRFQDELRALVDANCDNSDFWEPLRNAAVSCGAFPFAFRVKDLVRHRSEYPDPNVLFPLPLETFTYTDGGVFQNQPLGLAKNLVDDVDAHLDTETRFYLFISPHAKGSSALDHNKFNQSNADYKATAFQLVNAIYGQAGFQDWIEVEKLNQRIDLFNTRATQLATELAAGGIAPATLGGTASALLSLQFAGNPALMAASQARLRQQFQAQYDALQSSMGTAAADVWIDSILSFETAADLGEHDEMTIYGITATQDELASSDLMAFVGFFEQAYRDHDYDVGRTKAQTFLASPALGTPGNLPRLNYAPKPLQNINRWPDGIDHSLDGLTLVDVPQGLRQQMKNRLHDRADDLLKEANVSFLVRKGIEEFYVDPQLNKLLHL